MDGDIKWSNLTWRSAEFEGSLSPTDEEICGYTTINFKRAYSFKDIPIKWKDCYTEVFFKLIRNNFLLQILQGSPTLYIMCKVLNNLAGMSYWLIMCSLILTAGFTTVLVMVTEVNWTELNWTKLN